MPNHLRIYLGTFASCLVGGASWLALTSDHEAANAPVSLSGETSANRSSLPLSINWQEKAALSLTSGNPKDFALLLTNLGHHELAQIASEIHQAFQRDPDGTAAWLETLSLSLADANHHGQAAKLLDLLSFPKQVPAIERKIFQRWLTKSPSEAFASFTDSAKEGFIKEHQLSLIASVLQQESPEQLTTFTQWVNDTQDPVLKGTAIQKLVTHLKTENIEQIGELIVQNIDNGIVSAAAFDYVTKHSPEERTKTLEWVSSLPTENIGFKAQVFGRAIHTIATENVDQATELLSADQFLQKYYQEPYEPNAHQEGEWSSNAQRFFDITLQSFIRGAMFTDLELARNSAHSYFDANLRQEQLEFLDQNLGTSKPGGHSCEFCTDH